MFIKKKETDPTALDKLIAAYYMEIDREADAERKGLLTNQLIKLEELKSVQDPKFHVDWNVVLTVGANVLVALLIINHENTNVITTKAMNFVSKLR